MKPTVSCICVTQNRRFFLRRAIATWWRAAIRFEIVTGKRCELVIVDGSKESNQRTVDDARALQGELISKYNDGAPALIRYVWLPAESHKKTGWFHNQAVEASQGEFIIQWDDDDWHDPSRILKQYLTLQESGVPAFTFTSKYYLYHLTDRAASLSRGWYAGKIKGGSCGAMMAYHRATWEKVPFRDVPQGEDNFFWDDCKAAGIPFLDTEDPTYCIYVRHHQNGSPLTHANPDAQTTTMVRQLLEHAGDLEFYDELAELFPLSSWDRLRPPQNAYMQRRFDVFRRGNR